MTKLTRVRHVSVDQKETIKFQNYCSPFAVEVLLQIFEVIIYFMNYVAFGTLGALFGSSRLGRLFQLILGRGFRKELR